MRSVIRCFALPAVLLWSNAAAAQSEPAAAGEPSEAPEGTPPIGEPATRPEGTPPKLDAEAGASRADAPAEADEAQSEEAVQASPAAQGPVAAPSGPGATPPGPGSLTESPYAHRGSAAGPAAAEVAAPAVAATSAAAGPDASAWSDPEHLPRAVAAAAPPHEAPDRPAPPRPAPRTAPNLGVWVGVGLSRIASGGYDSFSEDDQLTTTSLGVRYTPTSFEGSSVSIVATADFGTAESSNRGAATELRFRRFGLGPEVGMPLFGPVSLYGRAALSVASLETELSDSGLGATLRDDHWAVGAEGAVGLSVRVLRMVPRGALAGLSLYVRAEGGFAWLPAYDLELGAEGGSGPVRTRPLPLGELDASALGSRLSIGAGF